MVFHGLMRVMFRGFVRVVMRDVVMIGFDSKQAGVLPSGGRERAEA